MIIREIRKDDIKKVIDIINKNYDEIMIKMHSKDVLLRFKAHNTVEDWDNQMKWKEIFVIENEEEIIATGALGNFGDSNSPKYCISNLFVEPKNHGKGIGKLLFKHLFKFARDKGVSVLHVPSSRNGFEFYKRSGFIKDEVQNDELNEITWMTMNILQ